MHGGPEWVAAVQGTVWSVEKSYNKAILTLGLSNCTRRERVPKLPDVVVGSSIQRVETFVCSLSGSHTNLEVAIGEWVEKENFEMAMMLIGCCATP